MATEQKALTLQQYAQDGRVVQRFANTLGGGTASEKANRANQFLSSLLTVCSGNRLFQNVKPESIMSSALVAASCDLSIVPTIGEAAIIPYGQSAQFQIMTNGLVQLAMRSGQIAALNACEIYADEYTGFDKIRGELKPLKDHNPECKTVVGYCAYVRLSNGGEHTEYWSREKVQAHASRYSKSVNNGPWKDNFDAMAKKTVLKYLINHYCPKSTQMQMALNADQAIVKDTADGLEFDYVDNPSNIVVEYSDEEIRERGEILNDLDLAGYPEDKLTKAYKGAHSADDIPTQYLRDLRAKVVVNG